MINDFSQCRVSLRLMFRMVFVCFLNSNSFICLGGLQVFLKIGIVLCLCIASTESSALNIVGVSFLFNLES